MLGTTSSSFAAAAVLASSLYSFGLGTSVPKYAPHLESFLAMSKAPRLAVAKRTTR